MGLGQEKALRERAATNKISYEPTPVLTEDTVSLSASQNGHLDVAIPK
jgi:hypothetical protein